MKPCPNNPFILSTLFILFSFSSARDTITPSAPLDDNETLVSSDRTHALGFFTPPKSNNRYIGLWYNLISETSDHTILWVANREDPLVNSTGLLSITKDGRLTISYHTSSVVWSTNSTKGLTNPIAQLLDNGNLVVKESGDLSGNYAWQGFNFLTDTLLPGVTLGVDFTRGINHTLTAWKSDNDPSPSTYHAYLDIRGDPELCTSNGPTVDWCSGAWVGTHFSGTPRMATYSSFSFSFVNNASEVTYSYRVSDRNIVTRLALTPAGLLHHANWSSDSNQWNFIWVAPKDECEIVGRCGPYGLCEISVSLSCSCLDGFVSPMNWDSRDGRRECVRKTELDCQKGTDGFMVLRSAVLPRSDNAIVDMSLNLGQCRDFCLKNCSCNGYASVNISGNGSGCVIWIGQLFNIRKDRNDFVNGGQDLYVRLAAADLPASGKSRLSRGATVAIPISLVGAVLLLSCVGCFLWRRKKERIIVLGAATSINEQSQSHHDQSGHALDLPLLDFDAVAAATDYFSVGNKLGEGGFGPVYKGKLGGDQEIAVKRLSKTSAQGVEEFKNEVMLIAKLQHRNLVRLLSCCIQGEERMLIYEYMPNKSLDAFLFEKGRGSLLDWKTRYQIILGIARGLLYLHQDSRLRIIHRDLKASNILLDNEMNPKISDFGMARIFGGDEKDFNTRKVVGTYGYMSPEYAMDGIFSVKSDVFSFGVLVLEIISGKRNRGAYPVAAHINLVSHAWSLSEEGESLQLVDDSMGYSFPANEVVKCIKVGLLCVQEHPEDRPLMSSVVLMLGSEITSLPQPKQPGFAARRDPFEVSNPDSCASNEMTVTMIEPR